MKFILQIQSEYGVDAAILKDLLDGEAHVHSFAEMSLTEMQQVLKKDSGKYAGQIPLGTIPFVNTFYSDVYGIKQMQPIEVPVCLRTREFLKRKYDIVPGSALPKTGEWFIKDVSELKRFSYNGNAKYLDRDEYQKDFDRSHLFVVSEVQDILSEYRVYIINGEISFLANYNGSPLLFPDIPLIQKANRIFSMQSYYPRSYTLDVMITKEGTSLIECHTMFATGIYSTVVGTNYLYAFRDADIYVRTKNQPPSEEAPLLG